MQLKRYSNEELQEIFTDIFYDYMVTEDKDSEYITPAHKVHADYVEKFNLYSHRILQYKQALENPNLNLEAVTSLKKQLNYLEKGRSYLESGNLKNQKSLYEETQSTDFSRSVVRIPLDKKLNSYYDDFTLEVLFYDDVCTLNGKFSTYEILETYETRLNFFKRNTEVTHIGLALIPDNTLRAIIEVKGMLNFTDPRVQECDVTLLPKKFSDFDTLTLKDISEIQNNDLKQLLQTKIDLDKENMILLSKQIIRGDEYSIYSSPVDKELYIRYICRSTGRIYFNRLNLENLKLSPEFVEHDCDSYARAWWNLNTLGGDVNGEPVIRC